MKGLPNSELKQKGWDWKGGSDCFTHPIMIAIITLTTLVDIKIVCDMAIEVPVCVCVCVCVNVCGWLRL